MSRAGRRPLDVCGPPGTWKGRASPFGSGGTGSGVTCVTPSPRGFPYAPSWGQPPCLGFSHRWASESVETGVEGWCPRVGDSERDGGPGTRRTPECEWETSHLPWSFGFTLSDVSPSGRPVSGCIRRPVSGWIRRPVSRYTRRPVSGYMRGPVSGCIHRPVSGVHTWTCVRVHTWICIRVRT